MMGLLVDSQGQRFEAHLQTFLPLLSECLQVQHEYSDSEGGPVSMAIEKAGVAMETDKVTMTTETVGDCDVVANGVTINGTGDDVINEEFTPNQDEIEKETVAVDERLLDHFLFRVLQTLCKVFTACPVIRSPVYRSTINGILGKGDTPQIGVSIGGYMCLSNLCEI